MGTKFEVDKDTGDITGTGTITYPGGHFTESLTISGVPVATGTVGGSGTPGGADTQVQFNDGGNFGGDAGLVYSKSTDALTGVNIFGTTAISGALLQTNELEVLTGAIDLSKAGLGVASEPYVGAAGVNVIINAGPVGSEVRLQTGGGTANMRVGNGTPTAPAAGGYASVETLSGTNAFMSGTVRAPTGTYTNSLTVSGIPVRLASDAALSFTHTQGSPATTWTVTHGLGTLTPLVDVYNTFNEMIQPNTASGISTSQYELKFNTSIAGKAFFAAQGAGLDLGNMDAVSATLGSFITITGTTGQFSGALSAQNVSASTSMTVSGVPVPLLSHPYKWQSNSHLSNQAYTASAEVDVAGITGIPLPLGHFTSTNGRTYRATSQLAFNNGTASNAQGVLSMFYGPNGGRGENVVTQGAYWVGASASTVNTVGPWQFTVTSGTATKIGMAFSQVQNGTILAQGSPTWLLVELVG